MTREQFVELLQRIETWPEPARAELAEVALEIEAGLDGPYRASPSELEGIDRGLGDVAEGRFASHEEIEAVFAKHRRV
jgi:predicted transcriptional regulator